MFYLAVLLFLDPGIVCCDLLVNSMVQRAPWSLDLCTQTMHLYSEHGAVELLVPKGWHLPSLLGVLGANQTTGNTKPMV